MGKSAITTHIVCDESEIPLLLASEIEVFAIDNRRYTINLVIARKFTNMRRFGIPELFVFNFCRFIQQSFIDMENIFDLMREKQEVSVLWGVV